MDHNMYTFDDEQTEQSEIIDESEELLEDSRSSDEILIRLIDLVKGYPHLIDKSNKDYKDAIMKQNSWTEIAVIMNIPVTDCQTRWTRLRERFNKEKKYIETGFKTGSGIAKRKPWALYDQMKFIEKDILIRNQFFNTPSISQRDKDIKDDASTSAGYKRNKQSNDKNNLLENSFVQLSSAVTHHINSSGDDDVEDCFAKYVAAKLRAKDNTTRQLVKAKILQILFE